MKFQNTLRRLPHDLNEKLRMRPAAPVHPVYPTIRWLAPWAVVMAMSTTIAHTADVFLVPSSTGVVVASSDSNRLRPLQMLDPLQAKSVLTRVYCPADLDTTEHEVLITTLQDIQVLEEGRCEIRS